MLLRFSFVGQRSFLFVGELFFLDLINMILLSYPTDPPSSQSFYSGQRGLQTVLLVIAVLCVPWMLLGKPIYRIVMNKRRANVRETLGRERNECLCQYLTIRRETTEDQPLIDEEKARRKMFTKRCFVL